MAALRAATKRPALPDVLLPRPSRIVRRRWGIKFRFRKEPEFEYRGLLKPPIRNSLKRSARLFLQPAHHAAQLLAGLLELGVCFQSTGSEELRTAACTVLLNPLGSEGTVLDLAQDLLHLLVWGEMFFVRLDDQYMFLFGRFGRDAA